MINHLAICRIAGLFVDGKRICVMISGIPIHKEKTNAFNHQPFKHRF